MAVADVLDALTSPRSYKPMVGAEEARRIVLAESGQHFDPDVVQAFERCFDHLAEIIRVHAL
jgi:HD-GYP domain-containing protein (c-di-GMP phosphodiesterase class II)